MKVINFRQTTTQPAAKIDDIVRSIADEVVSREGIYSYSWIDISPSMPIIMNGELHYTVTITAGTKR